MRTTTRTELRPSALVSPAQHLAAAGCPKSIRQRLGAAFLSAFAPTTQAAYGKDLAWFLSFADAWWQQAGGDGGLAPVRQLALCCWQYRAHLRAAGLSPATVNRRLACVQSFLTFLHEQDPSFPLPPRLKRLRHEPYRDTRGPSVEQVQRLFAAAADTEDPATSARNTALLSLLFGHALRVFQVATLRLEDVDLRERRLAILDKGRCERSPITLTSHSLEHLRQWLRVRPRNGDPEALFLALDRRAFGRPLTVRGVRYIVDRLGRKAGVRVWPHALRHAAITAALDQGMSIRSVQRFSRHRDARVLLRHYDDNRSDLAGEVASGLAEAVGKP